MLLVMLKKWDCHQSALNPARAPQEPGLVKTGCGNDLDQPAYVAVIQARASFVMDYSRKKGLSENIQLTK